MRISFLTSSYPRFGGDYAGWFVQEMARAATARGHDVTVYAPAQRLGDAGRTREDGVVVHRFWAQAPLVKNSLFYRMGAYENLQGSPLAVLEAIFSSFGFWIAACSAFMEADLVVSHWLVPSGLAAAAARMTAATSRTRHFCILHGSDIELARKIPAVVKASRMLSHEIDAAFAVSPRVAARAATLLPHSDARVLSLPAGLDGNFAPARHDSAGRRQKALFLGRLSPQKGIGLVFSALSLVPGLELVVAGPGKTGHLEAAARLLDLPVSFAGRVDPLERDALLATARVVVLGSMESSSGRGEGFPLVVREALARGVPVAATPSGGLAWAEGMRGLFVAAGFEPKDLARAVNDALDFGWFEPGPTNEYTEDFDAVVAVLEAECETA